MRNLPDISRAASSHFSGQNPQNKPKKTDKAPCSTFFRKCVCFYSLGRDKQTNSVCVLSHFSRVRLLPDLKTLVTASGSIRKTVWEKTNAHSICSKGIQQKKWEALSSLGAHGYSDVISKTVRMELDPCRKNISQNPPSKKKKKNLGNTNGAVFLPQMAKWGKHITLILIFWLFDNRQPLALFPQPSNRPYLYIAGLIDFSPERMHYSQVINCLKLFLNENAGNLWCSFLNGGWAEQFPNCLYQTFFQPIDSFSLSNY